MPRAQISQPALYEIGSAITLFQISNNADEFLAAAAGQPFKAAEVDEGSAAEIGVEGLAAVATSTTAATTQMGLSLAVPTCATASA